jgi:hypothetical protein
MAIGGAAIRTFGKTLFSIVISRLACRQAKPSAVIVDHDGDLIRIAEGSRAAIGRGSIEVSFWRSAPPDEF